MNSAPQFASQLEIVFRNFIFNVGNGLRGYFIMFVVAQYAA